MDQLLHAEKGVGWKYLSIPKLQRLQSWSFETFQEKIVVWSTLH